MQNRTTHRRGDLFVLDWRPGRGSEQAGKRPGLIVSNDLGNLVAPTVIVAAVTARVSNRRYPFQVRIPLTAQTGLVRDSTVNCSQLITVSKDRLERYIGALPPELLHQVDDALKVAFGLSE